MNITSKEINLAKIYLEDRYVEALKTKKNKQVFDGSYFDRVYLRNPDLWNDKKDVYQQTKFRNLMAALPRLVYNRALDVGCGKGMLTLMLSKRVNDVVGIDFSKKAVGDARLQCKSSTNISIRHCDLLKMPAGEQYDLIVCSELLYYLARAKQEAACKILLNLLSVKGHLMTVAPLFWEDYGKALKESPDLSLLKSEVFEFPRHLPYRISVFEKLNT